MAFGCPLCNKVFVLALGASTITTFIDPLRPAIGTLSVAALGAAVWIKAKALARGSCPLPPSTVQGQTGGDP